MGLLFKQSVCVQKLPSVPSICKTYTPSLIYYKAVYLSNNPFQSSSIYLEETYLKWAYCARNTNHALKNIQTHPDYKSTHFTITAL